MSIFTNASTCGFTETFEREERGDDQQMPELLPVLVEKGVLGARPGWQGSTESCETQLEMPAQLWSEAGWKGRKRTHVPEPNQSPGQLISLLLSCVICREVSSDTQK